MSEHHSQTTDTLFIAEDVDVIAERIWESRVTSRRKGWIVVAILTFVFFAWKGTLILHFVLFYLFLLSISFAATKYLALSNFMMYFAQRNGLEYVQAGTSEHRKGKLFAHEYTNYTTNVVRGEYVGHRFELFNYQYAVGRDKQKTTYYATVMQFTFGGLVPQFSLVELNDRLPAIHRMALGQRMYELEGDFHKYFKIYVRENHEIEMLEIMTPEIMAFIVDRGCTLSFEFVGNTLYVYQDSYIHKAVELQAFFDLTRMLVERLEKRIGRLHDDVEAITTVSNKRS